MANTQSSLPASITRLVVVLALSITLIYSLLILLYSWLVEDNIFNRLVASEAAYITENYQQQGLIPKPRSGFMSLHKDWAGVPEPIVNGYKIKPSRIEYTLEDNVTLHMQVMMLGDTEYVLLADVNAFEVSRDYLPNVIVWMIIFALVCAFIVSLLAFLIARRMTRPIKELAEQVKGLAADNVPVGFSEPYPDNELKTLAQTVEKSFVELQQALQREVNFTRDVSHELRTPISVLKNAMAAKTGEVTLSENESRQISQASFELERITDTLLALARSESSQQSRLNMTEMIENTVLQHFELNNSGRGKRLELQLDLEEGVFQKANQNLIQILLNNVLSNIVQYASGQDVQITLSEQSMSFTNHTSEMVPVEPEKRGVKSFSSTGIGQGLNLIERICQESNWRMQAEYNQPRFTLTVFFNN